MAEKHDGSIRIDTKLDNSGFAKGSDELRRAVKSLTEQVNETGSRIQGAFKFDFGQPKQAANTFSRALKQVTGEIEELGDLGQRALDGDADALARFESQSGEVFSRLEEMRAELERFGQTDFVTPEYAKASEQYQKAALNVDELSKSLEGAKSAVKTMEEEFRDSGQYAEIEKRIAALKRYQAAYEEARKNGDLAGQAQAYMESGVTKGSIEESIKEAEVELRKLHFIFENSKPYKVAQDEIEKISERLRQAEIDAQRYKTVMESTPATFSGSESAEYEKDSAAIQRAIDKFCEYRQLVREGTGAPAHSAEWDDLQQKWQNMTTMSGIIRNAFSGVFGMIASGARTAGSAITTGVTHPVQSLDRALGAAASGAGSAVSSLARLAGGAIASGIRKIASAAKSAATRLASMVGHGIINGLKKLGSAITSLGRKTGKTNGALGLNFKTILKYGLGIRSLYVLFNKLRGAIMEGFGTLAEKDAAFGQTVNNFKASLATLKNSFAAAFAPIAEVVLPLLTNLMNALSAALAKIGQFVAALTGKTTYRKATAVQAAVATGATDAAGAMKDESKAAKEAQKTLAGFDDVEILHDNSKNDSSSGTDNTGGGFEELPVESEFASLADALKDMWKNADFTELGKRLGSGLKKALDMIPWDYIKSVAAKLGKSAATLLNGFMEVPGLFTSIGKTIAEGINTIFTLLDAFASNLHWKSLGKAIKGLILGVLNGIDWPLIYHTLETFGAGIGTTIETAFNNPKIWKSIFTFLSNGIRGCVKGINAFLKSIRWGKLGANIAKGLNAGVEAVPWDEIADMLINGINGAFDLWFNFVTTFDFYKFGAHIGSTLSKTIRGIDWKKGGAGFAQTFNGLFNTLKGFIQNTDWAALGKAVIDAIVGFFSNISWADLAETTSSLFIGLFNALSAAIKEIDWKALPGQICEAIADFFKNFDWAGVAEAVGGLIGSAFKAIVDFGAGLWDMMVDFGKSIIDGGLQGIIDAIAGIGDWIWTHIVEPFIKGFKEAFGIASPAKKMVPLGGYIIDGFLRGIVDGFMGIVNWIKEHIVDPFVNGFKRLFGLDGEESALVKFGKNLIGGFLGGIWNIMSNIGSWIKEHIVDPFVNGFKRLFGLDGEESALITFGKTLINGFLGGIWSVMANIGGWLKEHIVDPVVNGVKGLFGLDGEESVFVGIGRNLIEGLKSGVGKAMVGIAGWLAPNVTTPILNAVLGQFGIGSPSKVFAGYGGFLIAGLKNGLLDSMNGIGGWISSKVTGPICGFFKNLFGINSPSTVFAGYGGDLMGGLEKGIQKNEDLPKTALSKAQESMQSAFGAARQLMAWVKAGSGMMTTGLQAGILAKTPAVISTVKELEGNMRKVVTDSYTAWKSTAITLMENVRAGLASKKQEIVETAAGIIAAAREKASSFGASMQTTGQNLMASLQAGMSMAVSSVTALAASTAAGIQSAFGSVNWTAVGSNIGSGVYTGFTATGGQLNTLAKNTATSMYDAACDALGIASPSKKFAWIGEMVTLGLGNSIDDTKDNAIGAVASMADSVVREAEEMSPVMRIDAAIGGIDGVLATFSDKLLTGFSSMISAMERIVSGASFTVPATAKGYVVPYSARRTAFKDEADSVSALAEILAQKDAGRLTRDDLADVLRDVIRQYLNIDFYIGDEQIARHANAGNARLNRRYSAAK